MKKKISAFIISAVIGLSAVSCADSSDTSTDGELLISDGMEKGVNVSEEDLPFGATMVDLYENEVPVSVSYERRFMTKEEALKISDYISAIENKDSELMESTSYKPYLDYLITQYGNTDIQDYLDSRYDTIADDYTGGAFDFNYIIINSMMTEKDDDSITGFSVLDGKIHEKSPDAEITSRKMIGAELMYSVDGDDGSYSLSNRTGSDMILYIYEIDGQIYIL